MSERLNQAVKSKRGCVTCEILKPKREVGIQAGFELATDPGSIGRHLKIVEAVILDSFTIHRDRFMLMNKCSNQQICGNQILVGIAPMSGAQGAHVCRNQNSRSF
jgi:hypothetical protein